MNGAKAGTMMARWQGLGGAGSPQGNPHEFVDLSDQTRGTRQHVQQAAPPLGPWSPSLVKSMTISLLPCCP